MCSSSLLALATLTMLAAIHPAAAQPQPPAGANAPTPLLTRFAADVDRERPLPEHPNPLLQRDSWQSLNGLWDYAITDAPEGEAVAADAHAMPQEWIERGICVPFPVESALSGVARGVKPNQALWYRTTFDAMDLLQVHPADAALDLRRPRVLLHFGAVDYHAAVFLNGQVVGEHSGGYDPFTIDITDRLRAHEPQELVVRVTDPTDTSFQPRGKQSLSPHGIWYTAVSGIWQTVWLESVPESAISSVGTLASPELGGVHVIASVDGEHEGDTVRFTIQARGEPPLVVEGSSNTPLWVGVDTPHLWSPSDPFLYDVTAQLLRAGQVIDTVRSYLALRTVELKLALDGFPRVHLNGQPIFLLGLLDQGWWPDGLYTAPTDEALRSDIEQTLAMGFNCARKHVKVEPARWYYWADRLGLLVLQDMPSGDGFIGPGDADLTRSPESEAAYRREYEAMVRGLQLHPSIIAWVPFNEGWGQFKTNEILRWAMDLHPTRLVDGPSGWTDRGTGHLIDAHVYPGPGMLPPQLPRDAMHGESAVPARASFLGEFGGLGLVVDGHLWKRDGSWGYRSLPDAATLERDYAQLIERLRPLQARGLAGAIYTQTTDVEIEVNGLMTYDRVPKIPVERLAAINARAFLPAPVIHDITRTAEGATDPAAMDAAATRPAGGLGATAWRYTTSDPGHNWQSPEFDDESWATGPAGFGTQGTPGAIVGTAWDSQSIWIRRTFDLPEKVAGLLGFGEFVTPPVVTLRLHHDEDVEVYLNGTLVHKAAGYQTGYIDVPLSGAPLNLLRYEGNTLAIRCTQTRGGQYIDAGLFLLIDPAR